MLEDSLKAFSFYSSTLVSLGEEETELVVGRGFPCGRVCGMRCCDEEYAWVG